MCLDEFVPSSLFLDCAFYAQIHLDLVVIIVFPLLSAILFQAGSSSQDKADYLSEVSLLQSVKNSRHIFLFIGLFL